MGDRPKLLYRAGRLFNALTGETLAAWPIVAERVVADEYRVEWTCRDGRPGGIREDERGIWLHEGDRRTPLAYGDVALPQFKTYRHGKLLRELHHEMLVNIVDGAPRPNLLAYRRPWYRDAAMVAMCLKLTDNLPLIADWVRSLDEPFDGNSQPGEADNLGQALYLISLVDDARHPLVGRVIDQAHRLRRGDHIAGLTDGREHPVYQTRWLQFGLRQLRLAEPWPLRAPDEPDLYASLLWMDAESPPAGPAGRFSVVQKNYYPSLAWAEAHTRRAEPPMLLCNPSWPHSWQARSAAADYEALAWVDANLSGNRLVMPHSWHAAEMFLYLIEQD